MSKSYRSELSQKYGWLNLSNRYQMPQLQNLASINKQYITGTRNTVIPKTYYPNRRMPNGYVRPLVPPNRWYRDLDIDGIPDRYDPNPYKPWWQNSHKPCWQQPGGGMDRNPFTPW